jgi:putative ABC transport system ATP-binding protein
MHTPLVKLQAVGKSYTLGKVDVTALREVTLTVDAGEFVALSGASGSGKTTLLNLIGCIDKPTAGNVQVAGVDVTHISLPALANIRSRKIGFIFQTFNLIPVLSAFENVEYPLLFAGLGRTQRQERARQWLKHVGLENQARQRPDQLSGGQRQRVAIARAMVTQPDLVLADEPTANLDSDTASQILDLMSQINRETGTTFLFATHDPQITDRASRQIHLRDGQIANDMILAEPPRRVANAH